MVTEEAKSKKQISEECIINRLPGDLIERIFLRLPVSTLFSCIGVCKHWHDFIRGPQFVTSHLQDAPRYAFLFFPQSFGFHPVTKEYKITHFLGDCIEGRPSNKHKFSFIQVYTLGDKKWKGIPTPEPLSLNSVRNSGVVNVDGTTYWLTEDKTASWQHTLASFDLREENFAMIQLPVEREDDDYFGPRMFWIRDIGGKLCIVTAQTSRYDARILVGELQIWTLDNPVEQRWSQKHNIKNPPNYIPGPHFVHMDRILAQSFFSVDSCELISENIEEVTEKIIKLYQVLVDSTHAISERVRTELDHVLQHKPENRNQPRFPRRLNWVERKRDKDELTLRSNKINDRMQAIHQAQKNISSIVRSYMPDQGISIPAVSSTADKNQ
ncbi:hypothetical protein ACQ4PT_063942 [Festuca glaucescens]